MKKRTRILVSIVGFCVVLGAVLVVSPLVSRWIRVSEYQKQIQLTPGRVEPALMSKMRELVLSEQWKEAAELAEIIGPVLRDDPEPMFFVMVALVVSGKTADARAVMSRAKTHFSQNPELRIDLETRHPELFWKIGFLFRED